VLGRFNSALPFPLFAFAARMLSASLMAILNATAPIWGAVIGAAWTRTAITPKALPGLVLGVGGVALRVGFDPSRLRAGAPLAMTSAPPRRSRSASSSRGSASRGATCSWPGRCAGTRCW
jgi:drug/metabolite transporter (DMT)-like permease